MDIFNVGAGEALLLLLIALLLFGPEDMVKLARDLGQYARRAQRMWLEFSSMLETELRAVEPAPPVDSDQPPEADRG